MSWLRVDDSFGDHPKVIALGDHLSPLMEQAAVGLWTAVGCWCSKHERAHFTEPALIRISPRLDKRTVRKLADALVTVGLWDATENGFAVHDFDAYRARIKRGSSMDRARVVHGSRMDPACHAQESPESQPSSDPLPTRPVPTRPVLTEEADSPPPSSGPSPSEIIAELAARYPSPKLLEEAREGCALTRRSGKMADSVWARTMTQLKASPVDAVEAALRDFVERHADGDKDERYLLGIVRGKAKRGSKPRGIARAATSEEFRGDDPAEFWGEVANG